jgi:hypothetical protein
MHRGDMPASRVSEENRYAVGSSSGDREPRHARHERVTLGICDRRSIIGCCDLSHQRAVNLALFKKTIERDAQALRESPAVLANGIFVIAQVKAQVQGVVRRCAHPALARGKHVLKSVPSKKV